MLKYEVKEIVKLIEDCELSNNELNLLCYFLEKLMLSAPTGHVRLKFANKGLMEALEEDGIHIAPKIVVDLDFDVEGIPEDEIEAISDEDIEALLKALAEPEEGGVEDEYNCM